MADNSGATRYAEALEALRDGRPARAESLLTATPDRTPRAAPSVYLLGVSLLAQGRTELARRVIDEAYAIKPWLRDVNPEDFDLSGAAEAAVQADADGRDVILVRPFTEAEDVSGFHAARGILTSMGGKASHAALVATPWNLYFLAGWIQAGGSRQVLKLSADQTAWEQDVDLPENRVDGAAAFDGEAVATGGAAKITDQASVSIRADETSELILVDVPLRFEAVGIWAGRI